MTHMNVTDASVSTIATSILESNQHAATGRTEYLRSLIAATQEALGYKKGQDAITQLNALNAQHARFYDIVLEAAGHLVPKGTKDRSTEVHRLCNFARTTLSAIRGHVRAGQDVAALNPAKVTKGALAVREGPQRALTPRRWRARAESQSKALMAAIIGLADADKAAAVDEIKVIMDQLNAQLLELVGEPTAQKRPRGRPKTVFIPTETQVIRQRANPS